MRHRPFFAFVTALLFVTGTSWAQNQAAQTVTRAGSQPSQRGPAENFTGQVTVERLFSANPSAPVGGAYVTFEAGARSNWHTHPAGQRLVVTQGVGRTGEWGGLVREIKAGDVVWCPPGVKHWHGASPASAMTHLTMTGTVNGQSVTWLEPVSDAQYNAGIPAMNTTHTLSAKQRAILPIAALTATGETEKLKTALSEGLEAGMTVNEIKEVLVQMYAYAGFPRSLNGIQSFMALLDERKARGIQDVIGREAAPLPANANRDELGARVRANLLGQKEIPPPSGYAAFAPVIDTFLKEHLFADIFARDILDYQSRELATVAALASLTGTRAQFQGHIGISLNVGLSETQMREAFSVLEAKVGQREAEGAREVLDAVLKERK